MSVGVHVVRRAHSAFGLIVDCSAARSDASEPPSLLGKRQLMFGGGWCVTV